MGQLILISGANGSGKSMFAEQWIGKTAGKRYYIATMLSCTEENEQRIQKHRRQRANLRFETVECPYQVKNVPMDADGVLLEDVSNLLANQIFVNGASMEDVFSDICELLHRCRILVAVTISGLREEEYEGETAAYIHSLNVLRQKLLEQAAVAVTLQQHRPMYEKGSVHDLHRIAFGCPIHV